MSKDQVKLPDHISQQYCQCSLCFENNAKNNSLQQKIQQFPDKSQNRNCMHFFIEYFPKNFPIPICPTTVAKSQIHYFNKVTKVPSTNPNHINNFTEQYRLMTTSCTNRLTEHFPLEVNLNIFYNKKTATVYKYELNKENKQYLYIQGYSVKVPIAVYYKYEPEQILKKKMSQSDQSSEMSNIRKSTNLIDEVLNEKLPQILLEIMKNQNYSFSEKSRQFFSWAHRQYGEQTFCLFVTKLYCMFIYQVSRDIILSGIFEWVTEKKGIARLANVKDLVIEKFKPIYSFQQQYEEKIKEKLEMRTVEQIKLLSTNKKKQPNQRIKNFRSNIKNMYEKQKLKIVKQTEKQRIVETKTMSDDIARLFLPDLHHYSSLREVLCDEQKFRKVVLGQKSTKKRISRQQLFNSAVKNSIKPIINKDRRHLRSKTEY